MSFNQELWDRLKAKGFNISDVYLQTGVGPQGGRMYVVIDNVAMSFAGARALDRGIVTLDEIDRQAGRREIEL